MLTAIAIATVAIAISLRLAAPTARELKTLLYTATSSPRLSPRERAELAARLWVA